MYSSLLHIIPFSMRTCSASFLFAHDDHISPSAECLLCLQCLDPEADWPGLHLGNARWAGRVEVIKRVIFFYFAKAESVEWLTPPLGGINSSLKERESR